MKYHENRKNVTKIVWDSWCVSKIQNSGINDHKCMLYLIFPIEGPWITAILSKFWTNDTPSCFSSGLSLVRGQHKLNQFLLIWEVLQKCWISMKFNCRSFDWIIWSKLFYDFQTNLSEGGSSRPTPRQISARLEQKMRLRETRKISWPVSGVLREF